MTELIESSRSAIKERLPLEDGTRTFDANSPLNDTPAEANDLLLTEREVEMLEQPQIATHMPPPQPEGPVGPFATSIQQENTRAMDTDPSFLQCHSKEAEGFFVLLNDSLLELELQVVRILNESSKVKRIPF